MAYIFIKVFSPRDVKKSLLHILNNQIELGNKKFLLTVKHKDESSKLYSGELDDIFNYDIQYYIDDIVVLEHYNGIQTNILNKEKTLLDIKERISNIDQFIEFNIRKNEYFIVIKNFPMYKYDLLDNIIISNKIFGYMGEVINNKILCYTQGIKKYKELYV